MLLAGIQKNVNKEIHQMKQPAVYILASRKNGTLYTGVTSDLVQRVWQHRNNLADGFTSKYKVHALVWYELHSTMYDAITREKQIKSWHRSWKIHLIEKSNADWSNLYTSLL